MLLEVLYWIDHVWSSTECVCCACDPSECLDQCFPTGAPWSPCALRCIVKGSARDDITNFFFFLRRNWGQLDGQNERDRTNEYTYNKITMITMYNAHE